MNALGGQYGKAYTDTADLILSADGMTQNALRLYIWLLRFTRSGDQLEGRDKKMLESWMGDHGVMDANAVQVAAFSLSDASSIFNDSKSEAQRQIARLSDCGIIAKAGTPARGHAQIYVINPNRYTSVTNGVTSGCVPIEQVTPNGVTSGCVPIPNGVTSAANKYASDGEWVYIDPRIGTHADAVTCDDETPSEIHHKSSEGVTPSPAPGAAGETCPECGARAVRVTNIYKPNKVARLFRCEACAHEVWRESA